MLSTIRKSVSRVPFNSTIKKMSASSAPIRDGVFRPKTTYEVWTGDAGAYPIMVGIGWCLFFGTSFGIYYFFSSPDVRPWGEARQQLFRGSLGEYKKSDFGHQ